MLFKSGEDFLRPPPQDFIRILPYESQDVGPRHLVFGHELILRPGGWSKRYIAGGLTP
jgi:hypothetical protein